MLNLILIWIITLIVFILPEIGLNIVLAENSFVSCLFLLLVSYANSISIELFSYFFYCTELVQLASRILHNHRIDSSHQSRFALYCNHFLLSRLQSQAKYVLEKHHQTIEKEYKKWRNA